MNTELFTLFDLISSIRKARKRIMLIVILLTALSVIVVLVIPRKWTSSARIIAPSSISSLAATSQIGSFQTMLGLGAGPNLPEVWSTIIRGESLTAKILNLELPVYTGGNGERLSEYLRADSFEEGYKRLQRNINLSVNSVTSTLTIKISARNPELAAFLANQLLGDLRKSITSLSTEHAQESLDFIESRIDTVESELRDAEDNLQHFRERNFSLDVPSLQRQHDVLIRKVLLKETAYTTLVQQYEIERIAAAKDDAGIAVLDAPRVPSKPSSPKRKRIVILVFCLSAIFSIAGTILGDAWSFYRRAASGQRAS